MRILHLARKIQPRSADHVRRAVAHATLGGPLRDRRILQRLALRYFLDTEFVDARPIEIISLGLVADEGPAFYGESDSIDWSKADDWHLRNVKPHLKGPVMSRVDLRRGIVDLVGEDPRPEFWGYVCASDWVAFYQLFGRLLDLPAGWPKICLDLKQWAIQLGNPPLPPKPADEHHALADSRWNRDVWYHLDRLASKSGSG